MTPLVPKPSTCYRQELRAYIQECLNAKYCMYIKNIYFNFNTALAINQLHAKVPYNQLKPSNVIGLAVLFKI